MKRTSLWPLCGLTAMIGACAGTMAPTGTLESSEAGIRAAKEVGADSVPQAKLHLQLAEEETQQAKALEKSDHDAAGFLLMRASSDAELALAMARESSLRSEAQKAADKVSSLKTQTQN